jgi:hypothetical protein
MIGGMRQFAAGIDPTGLISMFNAFQKENCPVFDSPKFLKIERQAQA